MSTVGICEGDTNLLVTNDFIVSNAECCFPIKENVCQASNIMCHFESLTQQTLELGFSSVMTDANKAWAVGGIQFQIVNNYGVTQIDDIW